MKLIENRCQDRKNRQFDMLTLEKARQIQQFHQSFPMYSQTPLAHLNDYANMTGVKDIYVKDESFRFGLNAFKVLGGSYAIGKYIGQKLGIPESELTYTYLTDKETKNKLGEMTFISATDGNHGRGVAWTANRLGQKSVILMPKGSSKERLSNIMAEGADARITELNYDDAVRLAYSMAQANGWVMVQDTAWEGYEDIPTWIMQGYMTMAYEAYQQLQGVRPTHIFIQAGVGALAGAVIGFFATLFGENRPIMTVVEPDEAACVFETMKANDGKRHFVTGDMNTIMAGLACGEPNTVSLEILKEYADYFISCPDYMAAQGMRILGNPLPNDDRVISGESGASSFGAVSEILRNPEYESMRKKLGLDEQSVVLFFSTEGDTDKCHYRKVVWDGDYHR